MNDKKRDANRVGSTAWFADVFLLTDKERWKAVGEPEIICHDDGEGGGCYYIGPDETPRVCEVCHADEPAEETDTCPECGHVTWWSPKCPECGKACTWTYGEIKPLEYEHILSANDQGEGRADSGPPVTKKDQQ